MIFAVINMYWKSEQFLIVVHSVYNEYFIGLRFLNRKFKKKTLSRPTESCSKNTNSEKNFKSKCFEFRFFHSISLRPSFMSRFSLCIERKFNYFFGSTLLLVFDTQIIETLMLQWAQTYAKCAKSITEHTANGSQTGFHESMHTDFCA